MKKINYFVYGIDIGGTNTKVSLFEVNVDKKSQKSSFEQYNNFNNDINQVFNFNYREFSFEIKLIDFIIFKTDQYKTFQYKTDQKISGSLINPKSTFIENIYLSFKTLKKKIGKNDKDKFAYSFAVPGFPDNLKKIVKGGSFNIEFLDQIDFIKIISDYDKNFAYISLVNDVTSQGYYEQVLEKDKFLNDYDIAVLIAIGTGIGGIAFTKNDIILGLNQWAGEFGHLPIWFEKFDKNVKCNCGKINCIEAFASVRAYINMLNQKGYNLNAEQAIIKYISKNADKQLIEITEFWLDALSSLISSFIYIFNPSIIIIAGSISKVESFTKLLYNKTKEKVNPLLMENVRFFPSSSAELSGTYGAAMHGIKTNYEILKNLEAKLISE